MREGKPITLSNSEPEPDIVVAQLPRSQYLEHHPFPNNIHLLVEVSKATRNYDLSTKKTLYAKENIPEYWVVYLANKKLIVYRYPQGQDYQQEIEVLATESISPLAFPDILITVSDIFTVDG